MKKICFQSKIDFAKKSIVLLIFFNRGAFGERLAEAIRSVDKMATRPIFVSICKDPRFHGIRSGIQDVAMDSADILRSYGIMVTTDDGMWRLMYGHAGNHYMNNHNMPDRL